MATVRNTDTVKRPAVPRAARPETLPSVIAAQLRQQIVAGEEGVHYFTLRQRWDPGAKYMPQSRHLLRKGNQRTRLKGGIHAADDDTCVATNSE